MTKKKKISIIVLSVILALLLIVGIVLLIVLNTRKTDPEVSAKVEAKDYFAGNKLSTVSLVVDSSNAEGEIYWVNPDELLKLGDYEYSWKFVPENTKKFNEITGKVHVNALEQSLETISVKTNPNKISGYYAFEELDTSGLIINANYDSGSINEITTGFTVIYQSLDGGGNPVQSFRAGDTKVTIEYEEKQVEIEIDAVQKFEVETPSIIGTYVYSGLPQKAVVEESELYRSYDDTATNAGEYNIYLELLDTDNCVWKETGLINDISIKFVIENAEQVVVEENFVGKYDGEGHGATASSDNATLIYYSFNELNSENYTSGSLSPVEVTEITDGTTVYYYAVGKTNYNDKMGTLLITITKTEARVVLDKSFAYSTGSVVELSDSYVTVFGVSSDIIDKANKITFTYYTSYESEENNQKTTSASSGSEREGSAPKNAGTYYAVATFAGDEIYTESYSAPSLFVIGSEPTGYYASGDEETFDWILKDVGYATFSKEEVSSSLTAFRVDSTIFGNGRIVLENGKYYLYSSNGKTYLVEISDTFDTVTLTDTSDSSNVVTLSKFEIPSFVGTYSRNTASDAESLSTMKIFAENGSIKYSFNYVYIDEVTGNTLSSTETGVVTYVESLVGASITFTRVSSSGQLSFFGDFNSESRTIQIRSFRVSSVDGRYYEVTE